MDMETGIPLETRMAKVFGDPVNLLIVSELNLTSMSPTQLAKRIPGTSVDQLDKKLKRLARFGWVARVGDKTGGNRRGSTEVFYRATRPLADRPLWPPIPEELSRGSEWSKLKEFHQHALAAMQNGSLDARHDRHLTWSALLLDDRGCQQVVAQLAACEKSLSRLAESSRRRMKTREGNRKGSRTTFFLAGFEIPPLGTTPT